MSIDYKLKRSGRAKRLRITIEKDASVLVVAPHWVGSSVIEKFVSEQRYWIERQVLRWKSKVKLLEPSGVVQGSYEACKSRSIKFVKGRVKHYAVLYGFEYNKIRVKQTTSQWGSCSADKNLSFTYKLLFLPEELADYVVVHELCHTRYMSHGQRFWGMVRGILPDYRERQKKIKDFIL